MQEAPYAFSSTYESALRRSAESWQEQADSTAQGSDRATFFVFWDEAPVGIGALYRLPNQVDVGELLQVWIAPEHRGKRAAWSLMDTIFKWAGENRFRTIIARVARENARAVRFYRNYGFTQADEHATDDPDSLVLAREVT